MKPSTYLPSLTWLRGIAAFLVVVSHGIRTVEGPWSVRSEGFADYLQQPLFLVRLFDLGSFGVCLFFALSGFTLYVSNRSTLQHPSDLPAFYVKRVTRIWPAFMVSLLVYTGFALWLWPHYQPVDQPWMEGNFQLPDYLLDALQYVFLLFDLNGPAGLFIGPYWSLPIEFHYYLLLAPVMVLMARRPRWRLCWPLATGAVLVTLGATEMAPIADTSLCTLALSFFLGVVLADLYVQQRLPRLPVWLTVVCIVAVFALVSGIWQGFLPWSWYLPAYTLASPLLIWAFLNISTEKAPAAVARLLANYGTYSYSVYLYHMLAYGALALLANVLHIQLNESRFWPVFVVAVVSSYGLAALSYRYVEEPSIALGRRLGRYFKRG